MTTTTTTPTSGAADLPEALRRSTAADGKTELFNLPGYPLMVRAVDFNRIHTESEMRRTALLDEMQKATLAAGQATAAQAVVPAEWPTNEMIDAGRKAAASQGRLLGSGQSLWHVFRAMLAAAPAQPAVEASRFGSPELQAMIIARCVEKDQADSGFDHKTAADFLSGKTVSDEALRKFVAASRGAHDARAALHAKMLSLQGELASREAEIALLKRSLLDAEADAAAPQPPQHQPPSKRGRLAIRKFGRRWRRFQSTTATAKGCAPRAALLAGAFAPQPSPTAQSADSVPAASDLPPLPAPDLRDVGTKPQEIKEFLKGYATEYARTAIAASARAADSVLEDAAQQPRLTVRLTAFPESNGKQNWTALLVRADKWDGLVGNCGGISLTRGELWNRVAYEAERARFLIGERDTEPFILDYGDDIKTPEEWKGEVYGGRKSSGAARKQGGSHD